jgi:hypothetical protein
MENNRFSNLSNESLKNLHTLLGAMANFDPEWVGRSEEVREMIIEESHNRALAMNAKREDSPKLITGTAPVTQYPVDFARKIADADEVSEWVSSNGVHEVTAQIRSNLAKNPRCRVGVPKLVIGRTYLVTSRGGQEAVLMYTFAAVGGLPLLWMITPDGREFRVPRDELTDVPAPVTQYPIQAARSIAKPMLEYVGFGKRSGQNWEHTDGRVGYLSFRFAGDGTDQMVSSVYMHISSGGGITNSPMLVVKFR